MLSKLLLLVIGVVALWYALKFFGRSRNAGTAAPSIEHTVKCPQCGVYVAKVNAQACGREACPYLPSGGPGAP